MLWLDQRTPCRVFMLLKSFFLDLSSCEDQCPWCLDLQETHIDSCGWCYCREHDCWDDSSRREPVLESTGLFCGCHSRRSPLCCTVTASLNSWSTSLSSKISTSSLAKPDMRHCPPCFIAVASFPSTWDSGLPSGHLIDCTLEFPPVMEQCSDEQKLAFD